MSTTTTTTMDNQAGATTKIPNLYQLSDAKLHVVYDRVSPIKAFTYQDLHQTLRFSGDAVRVADSEIGALVTVTTRPTIDAGSTSFTLLIPDVNLDANNHDPLRIFGITTLHRFGSSLVNHGQIEFYTAVELTGTASFRQQTGDVWPGPPTPGNDPSSGILFPPQKKPDFYQLQGDHLHVAYSPSIEGQSHLTYHDAHQALQFSGEEIRVLETEIGSLVTVTIHRTLDSGSTSFTLVIPSVNLNQSSREHIRTLGITTIHRFSAVAGFNLGQTELYALTDLRGTAAIQGEQKNC